MLENQTKESTIRAGITPAELCSATSAGDYLPIIAGEPCELVCFGASRNHILGRSKAAEFKNIAMGIEEDMPVLAVDLHAEIAPGYLGQAPFAVQGAASFFRA